MNTQEYKAAQEQKVKLRTKTKSGKWIIYTVTVSPSKISCDCYGYKNYRRCNHIDDALDMIQQGIYFVDYYKLCRICCNRKISDDIERASEMMCNPCWKQAQIDEYQVA